MDVYKSVSLLLMSSMEVSQIEQRAYIKTAVLCGQNANATQNAIILHDNATAHTADIVKTRVRRWRWKVLDYTPYSPDLSQCDFDLMPLIPPYGGSHSVSLGPHWAVEL